MNIENKNDKETLNEYLIEILDYSLKLNSIIENDYIFDIIKDYRNLLHKEELENMFLNNPVEDGDTISSAGKSELYNKDFCIRCVIKVIYGYNVLTNRGYLAYKLFKFQNDMPERYNHFINIFKNLENEFDIEYYRYVQ